MNYFIKLVCGYRKDQEHTISIDEAHKAYYLFANPEKRAVFSNGLALKGDQIQTILPNYHSSMGWNEQHVLDCDDFNEIRGKGLDKKLQKSMQFAKDVARIAKPNDLAQPLTSLKSTYSELLLAPSTETALKMITK